MNDEIERPLPNPMAHLHEGMDVSAFDLMRRIPSGPLEPTTGVNDNCILGQGMQGVDIFASDAVKIGAIGSPLLSA